MLFFVDIIVILQDKWIDGVIIVGQLVVFMIEEYVFVLVLVVVIDLVWYVVCIVYGVVM